MSGTLPKLCTVLVVEDDADVRATVGEMLESLGVHVVSAPNGITAVTLLEAQRPIDLALIDVVLPGGMCGYTVTTLARILRPCLPVLLMSGYVDDPLLEAAIGAGERVLPKPIRRAVLAEEIAAALRAAALRAARIAPR